MQGTPETMQENPSYKDLILEIKTFLSEAVERACSNGVKREMIILDPGIGFGKNFDHNLQIINELDQFQSLNQPILIGSSRKAFIGKILNKEAPDRDIGTMATIAAGIMKGANIVRVHNVKMAIDTVRIIDAIKRETAE
jgi:dihydropteroate synthase